MQEQQNLAGDSTKASEPEFRITDKGRIAVALMPFLDEPQLLPATNSVWDNIGSKLNSHVALFDACNSAIQIIEQLIPEPSARGVADVVLFELRAAIALAEAEVRTC